VCENNGHSPWNASSANNNFGRRKKKKFCEIIFDSDLSTVKLMEKI
jgi:hypothetical protein